MMYFILTLFISSGFCIQAEKECDGKWNVQYLSGNPNIKHLVTIDMANEDDTENYDCYYKRISERGIPAVTLFDKNTTDEKVHRVDMDAVKKAYLYRTNSIAFVILMPYPSVSNIAQCKYITVLRRHPKALVTFVFYKADDLLSKHRIELEDPIYFFVNYVLTKLKFMNVVGIILGPSLPTYFTYDVNKFDATSYVCGVKLSLNNFDYNMLVQQSQRLIENYPVRITTFNRPPTSIRLSEFAWQHFARRLVVQLSGNKVVGKDGLLIADIVKHFKFNPIYVPKPGIEPFGSFLSNGSINGVLGDVIKKNIEISSNSRFITSYGADDQYYFLGYNHFDQICAMVPRYEKVPIWIQVLKIYSKLTWLLLNIVAVLISVLRWIHFNLVKKRKKSLINVLFETYFSTIVPIGNFRHSSHRIILAVNLIIGIIFVPIFQGNIRSSYMKRKFYPSIDTLESLDNHITKIFLPFLDRRLVFPIGINELYDRLDKKIDPIDFDYIEYVMYNKLKPGQAILVPKTDAKVMLNFVKNSASRFTFVKACPWEYLFSFICSTDFPWAEEVELATHRLVAAGLPTWYYRMTEFTVQLITASHPPDQVPEFQALSLYILSGPFYVLAAGILMSIAVFFVEIVYSYSKIK